MDVITVLPDVSDARTISQSSCPNTSSGNAGAKRLTIIIPPLRSLRAAKHSPNVDGNEGEVTAAVMEESEGHLNDEHDIDDMYYSPGLPSSTSNLSAAAGTQQGNMDRTLAMGDETARVCSCEGGVTASDRVLLCEGCTRLVSTICGSLFKCRKSYSLSVVSF